MEDKETIIQRVINFLYDALDRFQDTMNDLNQNVGSLMNSLEKARGDLSGTGIKRTVADRSGVLSSISSRGGESSSSSREKLISLLSGKPITPPKPPIPAAGPPRPPAAGPPRPPAAMPPAAGPPRPPAAGPPRPPAAMPPAAGPPRPPAAMPPAAGPPRPPATAPVAPGPPRPATSPSPMAAGPTTGPPTISGLRDEMLKELKRLKAIMKGEK